MRILLIRPEDGLVDGPWAGLKWDRIVDFGRGGVHSYAEAAARFGSAVSFLDQFRENYGEIQRTRELLAFGKDRLKDRSGLDWWGLLAIEIHQQVETTILLQQLASTIAPQDEIWVSGPGFHSQALGAILGRRLEVFPERTASLGLRHYLKTLRTIPIRELGGIFWDKMDAGFEYRGVLSRKPIPRAKDVVLLPSAYVNVSRTGTAYASSVQDLNFLLVATRRSGWLSDLPPNVSAEWLRSYADRRSAERKAELRELVTQWKSLRHELEQVAEFKTISRCNVFDIFDYYFAHGLGIRDAWKNVLDSEPVKAVLCADDSNPFTHIPLLLAKARGLRTISCHHGALDGRTMVKECHADAVLAKGKMEQDYLTRLSGVPAEKVLVGAPSRGAHSTVHRNENLPFIVFFSEPYEATGGRAADTYADILPLISDLALKERRELIVKLHPAENARERASIMARTLTGEQHRNLRIISGPLTPELLDKTWFGITVLSTVALECALRQVPCFLCRWLESSPYGYVDEFVRFGLGTPLDYPSEIPEIPNRLTTSKHAVPSEDFWQEASAAFLKQLLSSSGEMPSGIINQRQLKSSV